jgi:3-oxoacid CoA-transferase subunit B
LLNFSENRVLGMGPFLLKEKKMRILSMQEQTITYRDLLIFDSALSFGMIRGQHVDCILGAMEVSTGALLEDSGKMVKDGGAGLKWKNNIILQ